MQLYSNSKLQVLLTQGQLQSVCFKWELIHATLTPQTSSFQGQHSPQQCCTTSDTAYRDLPPAASQTPRESLLRDVSNAFLTTSSSREGTRAALTEQSSSVQDSSPHRPYSHQYSASKISCADGGGEGTNLILRCAAPKRGGSAQFLRLVCLFVQPSGRRWFRLLNSRSYSCE